MKGNRHYIRADEAGRILEGWSDGLFPNRDAAGAVCIDDGGGYQFRLFFGGPENPALFEEHGVALYKWDGARVFPRTQEEIRAEIEALPPPGPPADLEYDAALLELDYRLTLCENGMGGLTGGEQQ